METKSPKEPKTEPSNVKKKLQTETKDKEAIIERKAVRTSSTPLTKSSKRMPSVANETKPFLFFWTMIASGSLELDSEFIMRAVVLVLTHKHKIVWESLKHRTAHRTPEELQSART